MGENHNSSNWNWLGILLWICVMGLIFYFGFYHPQAIPLIFVSIANFFIQIWGLIIGIIVLILVLSYLAYIIWKHFQ